MPDEENPLAREVRVRAILAGLSDSALIQAARQVAERGGSLSALLHVILDRFEAHIIKSAWELHRATMEGKARKPRKARKKIAPKTSSE